MGLFLARGLTDLCAMPPFEGWDEYQHVAYVVHLLETGRPAVLGQTEVHIPYGGDDPGFSTAGKCRTGARSSARCTGLSGILVAELRNPATPPPRDPDSTVIRTRLYQAAAFAVVLRAGGAAFRGVGGVQDLQRSVAGLRLVNLCSAAASVWVVLGVLARWVRSRRAAAWIGLAIAAQLLFLINAVRVSSDALGVFLATVVVALAMVRDDRRLTWRFGVMGMLTGLAILAKATNWSLVPIVAGPGCSRSSGTGRRPDGGWPRPWPWQRVCRLSSARRFSANLATYGVPTPMQEAVVGHQLGRGPGDLWHTARIFPWSRMARWLWLRGALFGAAGASRAVERAGSGLLLVCRCRDLGMGLVACDVRETASPRSARARSKGAVPRDPLRSWIRAGRRWCACSSAAA